MKGLSLFLPHARNHRAHHVRPTLRRRPPPLENHRARRSAPQFGVEDLPQVCDELRQFIVDVVSEKAVTSAPAWAWSS